MSEILNIKNENLALKKIIVELESVILGLCYRYKVENGTSSIEIEKGFQKATKKEITPSNSKEILANAIKLIDKIQQVGATDEAINLRNTFLNSLLIKISNLEPCKEGEIKAIIRSEIGKSINNTSLPYM